MSLQRFRNVSKEQIRAGGREGDVTRRGGGKMARARPEPPTVVNDPDIARATAMATRIAIKAAVAENVAVATYNRIVWTKSRFPTIRELGVLSGENGGSRPAKCRPT